MWSLKLKWGVEVTERMGLISGGSVHEMKMLRWTPLILTTVCLNKKPTLVWKESCTFKREWRLCWPSWRITNMQCLGRAVRPPYIHFSASRFYSPSFFFFFLRDNLKPSKWHSSSDNFQHGFHFLLREPVRKVFSTGLQEPLAQARHQSHLCLFFSIQFFKVVVCYQRKQKLHQLIPISCNLSCLSEHRSRLSFSC